MSTTVPRRAATGSSPARGARRRRLRLAVVALVVAVVATAVWMITRSPFLDVDDLVVRGTGRLTTDDVLAAAEVHVGDPLVWLDPRRAASRVEALPWVRDARVERLWPDTVRITIRERRAVAWIDPGNGSVLLVDPTGRVLAVDAVAPTGLPQLVDVDVVATAGETIAPTEGARVAGALEGLVQSGSRAISATGGRVTIVTASGQEIRIGEATQIADKLRAAVAVLGATGDRVVQYVDVSAPSNPVAG